MMFLLPFWRKSSTFHCLSSSNILSNISFAIYRRKITEGQNRTRWVNENENGHLWVNSNFVSHFTRCNGGIIFLPIIQAFLLHSGFNARTVMVSWYATLSGLGWFAMPLGCICYVDSSWLLKMHILSANRFKDQCRHLTIKVNDHSLYFEQQILLILLIYIYMCVCVCVCVYKYSKWIASFYILVVFVKSMLWCLN